MNRLLTNRSHACLIHSIRSARLKDLGVSRKAKIYCSNTSVNRSN